MTIQPHADTSDASPGQSDRRDRLIRVYDELDDEGKQRLLRLAEELQANVSGSTAAVLKIQDIYTSSNGDRWKLVNDTTAKCMFVRHEANPASGGSVTDTDVDDFLSIGGSGPEYAALRRTLNRL